MVTTDWLDLINQSKTIALFSHINSDGDANGSVMAMKHLLDAMGKETYVFVPSPISVSYAFTGVCDISCTKHLKSYDLAIGLDAPNPKRFGQCEPEFHKAQKTICIDHHADNEFYADITILDANISSTCELLYNLFIKNNLTITKDIATCLYLGISTDTGGFMHSLHGAVTVDTWKAVAQLGESGADMEKVNYEIFVHLRKPVFEIYRKGLNHVEFFEDGRIALLCINKRLLDETRAELNDTHKLTDLIGGIDGVEISAIMTQRKYREQVVSVRSKIHNAQRICKAFGGGGHLRAAGCRIFVPFAEAKAELLQECIKELKR